MKGGDKGNEIQVKRREEGGGNASKRVEAVVGEVVVEIGGIWRERGRERED